MEWVERQVGPEADRSTLRSRLSIGRRRSGSGDGTTERRADRRDFPFMADRAILTQRPWLAIIGGSSDESFRAHADASGPLTSRDQSNCIHFVNILHCSSLFISRPLLVPRFFFVLWIFAVRVFALDARFPVVD